MPRPWFQRRRIERRGGRPRCARRLRDWCGGRLRWQDPPRIAVGSARLRLARSRNSLSGSLDEGPASSPGFKARCSRTARGAMSSSSESGDGSIGRAPGRRSPSPLGRRRLGDRFALSPGRRPISRSRMSCAACRSVSVRRSAAARSSRNALICSARWSWLPPARRLARLPEVSPRGLWSCARAPRAPRDYWPLRRAAR